MDNGGDILQLCRLCLVKDDVNIPIFEEHGDIRQILQKISSCLPVKVSGEDKLPKKICDGCSYKLDMFYEFWNTTANSEKQLLKWLGEAEMNSKATDGTAPTVAQPLKPAETVVKQEAIDPSDIHTEENDDDKTYMFQQKFSTEEAASAPAASNEEPPPPKRARRTAAVKAQIAMDPESDDDEDSGEAITKIEDESEDSEGDDHEPSFVDVPSTSADDQPGPSGVGKDGGDAPNLRLAKGNQANVQLMKLRLQKPGRKQCKSSKLIVNPTELDEPLQCEACNASYKNNIDFAFHSKKHSKDGSYSCHLCDYKNTVKSLFESHVRAHEGIKKYKCELCSKSFRHSSYATEHKFVHSGEKPFQCEICGKRFVYSGSLSTHRRVSHYETITGKPLVKYDCKRCNKHYESHSGLVRHNSMHHKELGVDCSVLCDVCGKRISSKDKLKYHLRTHTGDKPYACSVCSKKFSKKEQLRTHERIHTGEKPFICAYCGKEFAQQAPFKYHIKTHTGERSHTCPICGKGFISQSNMKGHVQTCNVISRNDSASKKNEILLKKIYV